MLLGILRGKSVYSAAQSCLPLSGPYFLSSASDSQDGKAGMEASRLTKGRKPQEAQTKMARSNSTLVVKSSNSQGGFIPESSCCLISSIFPLQAPETRGMDISMVVLMPNDLNTTRGSCLQEGSYNTIL